jgi:hypothetical protein
MEGWKFNENVRRLATNQRIIDILTTLFGRKAWPFQTLNFPVGTQQHFHTDSVHFSSVPERFMCGVWTALEDISEDAGPLVYYPGSHKWPIYTNEHIGVCSIEAEEQVHQHTFEPTWRELVKEFDIKPQVFTPRKGQSLIWLSNLLHGGNKQANKNKTRWSQVTHYYFEGCAYYTPMHSDPFYGNIKFRELTDMMTGETVKNQYAGYDISPSFLEQSRAGFRSASVHLPEGFSPELYLEANPDVRDAGADPVQHYLNHGFVERRRIKP